MPRPFIHWDPAWNAADVVAPGDGPLVVDAGDVDRLARLVSLACGLRMFTDAAVGYQQEVVPEAGAGLRVGAYQYLPQGLTFLTADPVHGEPLPLDAADLVPPPWSAAPCWLHLGWRLPLRGYLGTAAGTGWAAGLEVTWADAAGARLAGATYGGYTGALLRTLALLPDQPPAMYHSWGLLHGKRPADTDWAYHPVRSTVLGVAAGPLTTHNGAASDRLRLAFSGGTPSTTTLQRWTGSAWALLHSDADDLGGLIPPVDDWRLRVGVVGDLVAGAALPQPGIPLIWPTAITRFSTLALDQFEPWVPDRALWSEREWAEHFAWLVTPSTPPFLQERQRPSCDLVHLHSTLPGGPTALRASDDTLGIGVGCGPTTVLMAWSPWDQAGYAPTALVPLVPTDEAAYGYAAPLCLTGRFRLDMAAWAATRPVDLLIAGRLWAPVPATDSGLGLHWEWTGPGAGEGDLVGTYWDDGAAAWATLRAPFDAAVWDGVPVAVALAWSGANGAPAGRPNYEIRLVINGCTRAVAIAPGLRLRNCLQISVGSDRAVVDGSRESFTGLFRAGMLFADAVSDDDLRRCWGDTAALDNPGFEVADLRPGEAVGWTWESAQAVGAWADWNQVREALLPWQTAQETMAAGWRFSTAWTYADEAARLAAVGFTAADVGGAAWQRDDDTLWQLTNHSPITWAALALGGTEAWAAALGAAAYAEFNAAARAYAGAVEAFRLWEYPPGSGLARPPWWDTWVWTPPWSDILGPGGGPSGWTGWYAAVYGAGLHPCPVETWGEAWGTDPLSTTGGAPWRPAGTRNGRRYGGALTLPLPVPPDHNQLWVWLDDGRVVNLTIPVATYATAAALAAALQAQWVAAVGAGSGLAWDAWQVGAAQGLAWGWDGVVINAAAAAPLTRLANPTDDARALLALTPGVRGAVRLRADECGPLPAGVADNEVFLLDGGGLLLFDVTGDPYLAGLMAIDDGRMPATFGASETPPDPTLWEWITLVGWYGAAAVWIAAYAGPELTQALFDTGVEPQELFLNTEWPLEVFP